jgi:Trypsin-co-occurring domain 1
MTQLTPIRLDDDTVIYIETTEDAVVPIVRSRSEADEEEVPITRGFPSVVEAQQQAIQSFQAIEGTIRAYTTHTLNAFRNLAVANVDKVTLRFGIELGGEAGVPYVTRGTAKSNLNIEVECSFPERKSEKKSA